MGFHETTFPDNISYGASSGPGFKTLITSLRSGAEERVSRWSNPRRRFNFSFNDEDHSDAAEIANFAILRNGAEFGFRIRDWSDYNSTQSGVSAELGGADPSSDDQSIGTGDGSKTQFQLVKRYEDSIAPTKIRKIEKPRASTVLVSVDGVEQTEGTDYTVNTATGVITFDAGSVPADLSSIRAGFEFDTPVRFTKSVDEWLEIAINDYNNAVVSNLEAIEIIDPSSSDEDYWYGGASDITLSANAETSISNGRVQVVTATAAGRELILPPTNMIPRGGPHFYFVGESGTLDFTIVNQAGSTVATVSDGDIVEILLLADQTWRAK